MNMDNISTRTILIENFPISISIVQFMGLQGFNLEHEI